VVHITIHAASLPTARARSLEELVPVCPRKSHICQIFSSIPVNRYPTIFCFSFRSPVYQKPVATTIIVEMAQKVDTAHQHLERGEINSSRSSDDIVTHHMSVKEYCITRFTTLRPASNKFENPIKVLSLLNRSQWLFFTAGFLAWMWDGTVAGLIAYATC